MGNDSSKEQAVSSKSEVGGASAAKFTKEDEYFAMVKRRRLKDQERHEKESQQRGKAYEQLRKRFEQTKNEQEAQRQK